MVHQRGEYRNYRNMAMWNGVPQFGRCVWVYALVWGLSLSIGPSLYSQEALSPFTTTPFTPDGQICEFIQFDGGCQEYFITDLGFLGQDNFGAIKVGAMLTRGVFVGRDNDPVAGSNASSGSTGFFDPPAAASQQGVYIPTGFNLGRVFTSYNRDAFGRTGGYFIGVDISAPSELDRDGGNQPIAFDLDGDGSRFTITEIDPDNCFISQFSESPSRTLLFFLDNYTVGIDTDLDGIADVTILVGERRGSVLPGALQLGPPQCIPTTKEAAEMGTCPQSIDSCSDCSGADCSCVFRFVFFRDETGLLSGTPQEQALHFLDVNGDGLVNELDVGVDDDIEIGIRNVHELPTFTLGMPVSESPACVGFSFTADTFDDVCLNGGGEDATDLVVNFPVPDIEVTKEARCADVPDSAFSRDVSVLEGGTLEYRVTVQNWGNRELDVSILNDDLSCNAPAAFQLISNSCTVSTAPNVPGFDPQAFCDDFEGALTGQQPFPLTNVISLPPSDLCRTGPGEPFVFTYQVKILSQPGTPDDAFCGDQIDCSNGISVSGTFSMAEDPILAPSPTDNVSPDGDAEEEDCSNDDCCTGIDGCVPNDGVGDVQDEFFFTAFDRDEIAPLTRREKEIGEDDNRVNVEIKCRDISLIKEVRRAPNGFFRTGTSRLEILSLPVTLEYRYTATNHGEIDEAITISDPDLCADVQGIINAFPGEASFGACPICTQAPIGQFTEDVPGGDQQSATSCLITFNSDRALRRVTRSDDNRPACRVINDDGEGDVLCYRNCADAQGVGTHLNGTCPDGSIFADSFATVCYAPCDIEVAKQVRCVDSCASPPGTEGPADKKEIVPGSTVQFVISVTNTSTDVPLCALRFSDMLAGQLDCLQLCNGVDPVFAVDGEICSDVPPGFNVDGFLFDWFPRLNCDGKEALEPGETLTLTFNAQVFETADADTCDCTGTMNRVRVDGRAVCSQETLFGFTCNDEEDACVDVVEPRLTCLNQEWAYRWDADADCEPDGPFDGSEVYASAIDLKEVVFPVDLRLRVTARNMGDVELQIIPEDNELGDCVDTIPGVSFVDPGVCEIRTNQTAGLAKPIGINQQGQWFCDIRVDTAEAMRALDACDRTVDGLYSSTALVLGVFDSQITEVCVPDESVLTGDASCPASIEVPQPCNLRVEKQVKCTDDPDTAYTEAVDVVPGSSQSWRIQVTNTHASTKIPRVCLTDELSDLCIPWLAENSIVANIAGDDVTACVKEKFAAVLLGDTGDCFTFEMDACRPLAPWIAPGERLTVKFESKVPEDHKIVGTSPDCVNEIIAEGRSEVCVPPTVDDVACDVDDDEAEIDVIIPGVSCEKLVCADYDENGKCDTEQTADLQLACDTFRLHEAIRLHYCWTVTNTGETPLTDVRICDEELRADAVAAGLPVSECIIPDQPDGCGGLFDLSVGESATACCDINVPTRLHWEIFAGLDDDLDEICYTNTSEANVNVEVSDICDAGADIGRMSEPCTARVCLAPECQIEVSKQVRCLDNCTEQNPVGNAADLLQAAGGSCVQFEVNVTNTDPVLGICRLRLADTLSHQGDQIVPDLGSARFFVGATDCPVPAGFNVDGTPFEWDPTECGLADLPPGGVLTFTFNATLPETASADIDPLNTVMVDGAPTCPDSGPNFCCNDSDEATVDILEPSLACLGKEWSYSWDTNGDCEPDTVPTDFTSMIDLRNIVFPARLTLRVRAVNDGDVALQITPRDSELAGCVLATPGVSFCDLASCELSVSKPVAVGAEETWLCDICVEAAEALRNLDACDGADDGFYRNNATVSGLLDRADTEICVPPQRVIEGDNEACNASIQTPESCEFDLTKEVKCTDEPDSAYIPTTLALPGSELRFRIQVTNTSDHTKIPRVCINDDLGNLCAPWLVTGSVTADLAGTDVTNCVQPMFGNTLGTTDDPNCYTFEACRSASAWIGSGETLTITFDVKVPENYEKEGIVPDCENLISVDGFSEACRPLSLPDDFCATGEADADIDVLLPVLECSKDVRSDEGNDGTFETNYNVAQDLLCDAEFPLRLDYRLTANNIGEAPLTDARLCDPQLLESARAAGAIIGPCDWDTPEGCAALSDLATGSVQQAFCQIVFPTRAEWDLFANNDNCHNNEGFAQATVDVGQTTCDAAADITVRSQACAATVCIDDKCQLEVTKQVVCLDDCQNPGSGDVPVDRLEAAANSCVQFEIRVRNLSDQDALCRLRLTDCLGQLGDAITYLGNPRFQVVTDNTSVDCPVPVDFNAACSPFEWNPATCNLGSGLTPEHTLIITFDAQVTGGATATTEINNAVTVEAAPTCQGGTPSYCCEGSDEADVGVRGASLTCDEKAWAFLWDQDGDCEPDGVYDGTETYASNIVLDEQIFPVLLRLRVESSNTGDVPLEIIPNDVQLGDCVTNTPGVSFVNPGLCEIKTAHTVGAAKTVPAGGSEVWFCDVRVESADAMRTLASCDTSADGIYTNQANVSGKPVENGTDICVPPNQMIAGNETCPATITAPPLCLFDLEKRVACLENCGEDLSGDATEVLKTVAGSYARYEIKVHNTHSDVRIPRICIEDTLSCSEWICPDTVRAILAGTDVSSDFGEFRMDGVQSCFTFASRTSAPWIAPDETLSITFDVRIPEGSGGGDDGRNSGGGGNGDSGTGLGFGDETQGAECINDVFVAGFSEACNSEGVTACDTGQDAASIDVQEPSIDCDKRLAADVNNDGQLDIGNTDELHLSNPEFPLRLIYTLTAENNGELPLTNVRICDVDWVASAVHAGITVGPCGLCNGPCDGIDDTCTTVGNLAAGASASVTCELLIEDVARWNALAGVDEVETCYRNKVQATGDVDPQCAPVGFEATVTSQPCEALACITIINPCPTTKAKFDIWNQNEVRFSGTQRCVISWDQKFFSEYMPGNIANHFLRTALQTNKGKTRIDGVSSPNVCGASSIAAPLLGVSTRLMNFGRIGVDYSARTLPGSGEQSGTILYQPGGLLRSTLSDVSPKDASRKEVRGVPAHPNDLLIDGSITGMGSFLAFLAVEVKWDVDGNVIQDSFLALNNDSDRDVLVQLYLVNGDQPLDALLVGDPPVELERAHPGCNWVDNVITLTGNEPTYWSVLSGLPKGVAPITVLDSGDPPGRPDHDMRNPKGRVLRGYVLAWAVNSQGNEIKWNQLSGTTTTVNYLDASASEYNAWSFQALAGAGTGSQLLAPLGRLDFDGLEYEMAPDKLIMDFFAAGSILTSEMGAAVFVDTDLTLWALQKDLRRP